MKRPIRFIAICAVLLLALLTSAHADGEVTKITFRNKTSEKVFVALQWWSDGSDSSTWTKGWWGVDPGKSRTITWPGHMGPYVAGYMGYYATAKGLAWSGRNEDDPEGWIHPTKAFDHEESNGESIPGGKVVKFRMVEVNRLEDGNIGATVTLTR